MTKKNRRAEKQRSIFEVALINQRRKRPHQPRSVALVDALKISAREILKTEGRQALSLQRLSDYSGVAVSSIYEYFPTLDALVAGIFADYWEEELSAALDDIRGLPPSATLYDGIVLMLETILCMRRRYLEIDPQAEARSVEYEELIRLGLVTPDEARPGGMSRALIERFPNEVRAANREKAEYFFNQTAVALNRIVALERPAYLGEADTITLMARMLHALLTEH